MGDNHFEKFFDTKEEAVKWVESNPDKDTHRPRRVEIIGDDFKKTGIFKWLVLWSYRESEYSFGELYPTMPIEL